ncbi:MAG: amphi-Trp domain-containing protein [Miltoncostaeaceae bacterium]
MSKLVEVEVKERMSREEAAEVLQRLADSLARHNDVEFRRHGKQVRIHVPDEVELEVELEVSTDGGELEVELSW